jgi:signal transduction histidine kinase
MAVETPSTDELDHGVLQFSVESRLLRELGERLVRQPEVALLELAKNAFDADARICDIEQKHPEHISVADDGLGMTLEEFKRGWMRIGTSSKEASPHSRSFGRVITGEKGIGRFAVRFLGKTLHLTTVAQDPKRRLRTRLTADFDWPKFDRDEDLGRIDVPYKLFRASDNEPTGTHLRITRLRPDALLIDLDAVRTASMSVVSPYRALLREAPTTRKALRPEQKELDPGFTVRIRPSTQADDGDVARTILDSFVLRAVVDLRDDRLRVQVFRRGEKAPTIDITDRYSNEVRQIYADIRFFPQRKGTFTDLPVDGRLAKTWIKSHSGVAVFDRTFRVHPYGLPEDDWLLLSADAAKRTREPRSKLAQKHFPMDEATRLSTQLNYMLKLPYPQQLVGVVQVQGRRTRDSAAASETGLIAAADREGFLENAALRQLKDIIRGAVEAIACADRELLQELEQAEQRETIQRLRIETQAAIREIEANPNIARAEKSRLVRYIAKTQELAEQHEERSRAREASLEVMSLLGIVAGYMTHEFGTAFDELEKADKLLQPLAKRDPAFKHAADGIARCLTHLREFVIYSQGYIHGTTSRPSKPYSARSRLQRTARIFGKYAEDRSISVRVEAESDVLAPLIPVSLYDGVALNLYTNALKAVTGKTGNGDRVIAFRAWNDQQSHYLEALDTGIGIPSALRHRVFDPLFTTTASNQDPLGSGMGLGLSLVKRGVESYGGRVEVVDPPTGFSTCVRIRLPLAQEEDA